MGTLPSPVVGTNFFLYCNQSIIFLLLCSFVFFMDPSDAKDSLEICVSQCPDQDMNNMQVMTALF